MYATLLGSCITTEAPSGKTPPTELQFQENEIQENKQEEGGEEPMEIENDTVENLDYITRNKPPTFNVTAENKDKQVTDVQEEDGNENKKQDKNETESNFLTKESIEQDWSVDSDSDNQNNSVETEKCNKNATIESHKDEILDKILEKPVDNPAPVKLVISKKKGSIFKSRSLVSDGPKTRRALYRHKFGDPDYERKSDNNTENKNRGEFDFEFQNDPLVRITKENIDDETISSVKCSKSDKGVSFLFYYIYLNNIFLLSTRQL